MDHWKAYMATVPEFGDADCEARFEEVFGDAYGDDPTQRDATVAASFICWLGCNVGAGYLTESRRQFEREGQRAYLQTWSVMNLRRGWKGGGRRKLDAILPPPWDLTARDVEIVDHAAWWLGSPDGQKLIREAEAEIEETGRQIQHNNQMQRRAALRAAELTEKQ